MKSLFSAIFLSLALFSNLSADYQAKSFDHLIGKLPGIDDELLKIHLKLYQGYVNQTNHLLSTLGKMEKEGKRRTAEYSGLKRMFGWEWNGMYLHELYFDHLGYEGDLNKESRFYQALIKEFGTFEAWKEDFHSTGLIRGIGWAILYFDPKNERLVNTWINEHDLGHLAGGIPLIVMDVFEHAYLTQYGLDRSSYIEAFFKNIKWRKVEERCLSGSLRD